MPQTDDFNRADSNSLGSNWTEVEDGAADLSIESNELRADSNHGNDRAFAYWNMDVGDDHYSELEFRSFDIIIENPRSGPAVRIDTGSTPGAFTAYVCFYDPGAGKISLRKYVGQSLSTGGTVLGTYDVTLSPGDKLRIQAVGSVIKVFVNGDEKIAATDTDITGGRPGIAMNTGYAVG